jgi:hypothetical protein
MLRRALWVGAVLTQLGPSAVWAHFHMLLPEAAVAVTDKPVSFLFQWGHP